MSIDLSKLTPANMTARETKHIELYARADDENGDKHFVPLDTLVNQAIEVAILEERQNQNKAYRELLSAVQDVTRRIGDAASPLWIRQQFEGVLRKHWVVE